MKKSILICLVLILTVCALLLSVTACKEEQSKPIVLKLSFDVGEIECDTPQSFDVTVGEPFELPYPTVEEIPDGYELKWFIDKECTTVFDENALGEKDLVLYLGYSPKTYSITYTNGDEFEFNGELPTSYVYGVGVKLPQAKAGVGYLENSGSWYYEDEKYFTTAVSSEVFGDLVLTYKPVAIKYKVVYVCGVEGAEHQNPTEYDVTMGKVDLLPATAEGKTFLYWEYRSSKGNQGKIESLDIDLFVKGGMSFSLWAVWAD